MGHPRWFERAVASIGGGLSLHAGLCRRRIFRAAKTA